MENVKTTQQKNREQTRKRGKTFWPKKKTKRKINKIEKQTK